MQSSSWYKPLETKPGTHSRASSYWLPSHEPSENAAIQILTLHSAYITFAASLSASALRWSFLPSLPRLHAGVLVVTSPRPAPWALHPPVAPTLLWSISPSLSLTGSAFPCHPHNTQHIYGTQEPKLLTATRVSISAACAWPNTLLNTVLLQC